MASYDFIDYSPLSFGVRPLEALQQRLEGILKAVAYGAFLGYAYRLSG